MIFSPLEQFEIFVCYVLSDRWLTFLFVGVLDLMTGGLNFGFPKQIHIILSNYFLIFSICFLLIYLFFFIETIKLFIIPKIWFLFLEFLYNFVFEIIYQQIGIIKKGRNNWYTLQFFPFLFTLFIFLFLYNFIGLIPFGFTLTSHLITTFTLSFLVFLGFTLIGVLKHQFKFFKLFIPSNIPKMLSIFLSIIEIISYISRVFSLSIRLFANMMSGHALLFILTSFIFKIKNLVNFSIIFIWVCLIPAILVFLIFFLELGIAFLQAYVFVVLSAIYLNDVLFGPNAH